MRQLRAEDFATGRDGTVRIDALREHIAVDLAADVARLLDSGATFDGKPIEAGDIALLLSSVKRVDAIRAALAAHGIPSVVAGGSNVMLSQAADEWLVLLEALEQQRTNRVRAVALTSFIGETPQSLDSGGDVLADDVAERVRSWLDLFRTRGIAAVHEAARAAGLAGRVLAQPDGERLLTDLEHLGQMLHETARRNRLGLPALLEWFRSERRDALASTERTRRLDTDAAAVQILTIHGSKGLEYPVVYLPHFFDCYVPEPTELLFHDDDGTRRLDLAGSPDALRRARAESAGEELRLTYVALTRAQSQVVTWWGPSQNAAHSGLSRLLFGRTAGEPKVPERVAGADRLRGDRCAGRVAGGGRAGARARGARAGAGAPWRRSRRPGRRTPLHADDRHRLASYVLLGLDPRRGAGRQHRGRCRAGGSGDG